jgi:hypothetical protein
VQTIKEIGTLIGAIAGLITALAPVCAYFFGKKKKRRRRRPTTPQDAPSDWRKPAATLRIGSRPAGFGPAAAPVLEAIPVSPEEEAEDQEDPAAYERARRLVRAPAIAMLTLGCVGLISNLLVAGFGYVDDFVSPLSSTGQREWQDEKAAHQQEAAGRGDVQTQVVLQKAAQRKSSAVMAIVMLLIFALGSAITTWAAYNMLHLHNYWLAMLGSVSVIPSACLCCCLGVPSGIWSIVVLLRPEVSSIFG